MAYTRKNIEDQITAKVQQGRSRKQAIAELLKAADKGATQSEKAVVLAQEQIMSLQNQIVTLKSTIASEGRNSSLEYQRIAILKEIQKEERKQE